jgi:hypothetical protein
MIYAGHLEKCQESAVERGMAVETITAGSAGNRLFRFPDLDGNAIEVCVEL